MDINIKYKYYNSCRRSYTVLQSILAKKGCALISSTPASPDPTVVKTFTDRIIPEQFLSKQCVESLEPPWVSGHKEASYYISLLLAYLISHLGSLEEAEGKERTIFGLASFPGLPCFCSSVCTHYIYMEVEKQ